MSRDDDTVPLADATSPSAQTKGLPSSDAASAFLEGERGGTIALFSSTLLRSGLILPGLLLAGVPLKKALLASALSSISITTFILIYMSGKKLQAREQSVVAQLGRRAPAKQLNGYQAHAWGKTRGDSLAAEWRRNYRAGRRVATVKGL